MASKSSKLKSKMFPKQAGAALTPGVAKANNDPTEVVIGNPEKLATSIIESFSDDKNVKTVIKSFTDSIKTINDNIAIIKEMSVAIVRGMYGTSVQQNTKYTAVKTPNQVDLKDTLANHIYKVLQGIKKSFSSIIDSTEEGGSESVVDEDWYDDILEYHEDNHDLLEDIYEVISAQRPSVEGEKSSGTIDIFVKNLDGNTLTALQTISDMIGKSSPKAAAMQMQPLFEVFMQLQRISQVAAETDTTQLNTSLASIVSDTLPLLNKLISNDVLINAKLSSNPFSELIMMFQDLNSAVDEAGIVMNRGLDDLNFILEYLTTDSDGLFGYMNEFSKKADSFDPTDFNLYIFEHLKKVMSEINQSSVLANDITGNVDTLQDVLKKITDDKGIISHFNDFDKLEIKEESITKLEDTINSVNGLFSNLKSMSFDSVSDSINNIIGSADQFSKMCDNFGNLPDKGMKFIENLNTLISNLEKYSKKAESGAKEGAENLKAVFSTLSTIGGFDEKGFKTLEKNVRKMIKMFGTPSLLTDMGFSSTGLLTKLVESINNLKFTMQETSKTTKGTSEETKTFTSNMSIISSLISDMMTKSTFDTERLQEFQDSIEELKNVFSPTGAFTTLFNSIQKNKPKEAVIKNLTSYKDILKNIDDLTSEKSNVQHIIADLMMYKVASMLMRSVAKTLHKLDGRNLIKVKNNVEKVAEIVKLMGKIKSKNIKNAQEFATGLFGLNIALALAHKTYKEKTLDNLVNEMEDLNKLIVASQSIQISDDDMDRMEASSKFMKSFVVLNALLGVVGPAAPFALLGLMVMSKEVPLIQKIVDGAKNLKVEKDTLDNLKNVGILLGVCAGILVAAALVGDLVMKKFGAILGFSALLMAFMYGTIMAVKFASKGMDTALLDKVKEFGMLLAICGGVLILGGLLMTIPMVAIGALAFIPLLSAFMFGVTFAVSKGLSGMDSELLDKAEQFSDLVIVSAMTLVIGGAAMMIPGMVLSALLFGVVLTAFIGGVIAIYGFAGKFISQELEHAKDFAILVGISAASLLIGGMLFMMNPWMIATTLLFGVVLTAFIGGVLAIYGFAGKFISQELEHAKEFGLLIALSSMALCLGGFLFKQYPWMILTTLLFGVILVAFVGGVIAAYGYASKFLGNRGIKSAKALAMIVGMSAAILLIGGAFMMIPGMALGVLEFAVILGLFVAGISFAYSLGAKMIGKKGIVMAISLGLIVALSSIAILAGGYLFMQYPDLPMATLAFVGTLAITVAGIGLICGIMGKFAKNIGLGELLMAGIIGLVWLANKVMQGICVTAMLISGHEDEFKFIVEQMGWIIGGFLAAVAGIVVALCIPGLGQTIGVAMAAAEALLGGVVGLVWLAGKAMGAIADAMLKFNNVEELDTKVIIGNIGGLLEICWALKPFMNPLIDVCISAAASTVSDLGKMMSKLSEGIQSYANLKIPIYDGDKISGYRQLTDSDFQSAADNIAKIVTIIGGSILDIYEKNKDIFSAGWAGDLLGQDTPFTRVVKSCTSMGNMIAKIAEGVKDMATLTVPVYDAKGNKTGVRSLEDKDFDSAARNVSLIVTTLGGAIMGLYNEDKLNMFKDTSWWGAVSGGSASKTPFGIVIKSSSMMGQMISTIAKGVRDMAQLRVPTYDKDGKENGSRELTPIDFINAAANTNTIVMVLANAIMDVYKKNSWMFTDPSMWHTSADKTPFGMTVKAISGIGNLISEAAKGVKDVAELNFVGADGKTKIPITLDMLKEGGIVAQKVDALLTAVAVPIINTYNAHKDIFDDGSWFGSGDAEDTDFGRVSACLTGAVKVLDQAAKSINQLFGYEKIDWDNVTSYVSTAISAIPTAIVETCFDDEGDLLPIYDDIDDWDKQIKKAFEIYRDIIGHVSDAFSKVNKLMQNGVTTESMHDIGKFIYYGISQLYASFKNYTDIEVNDDLENAFKTYKGAISKVIDAFKNINEFKQELSNTYADDENPITIMSDMINSMLTSVGKTNIYLDEDDISLLTSSFVVAARNYNAGMSSFIELFNKAPEETVKYSNVEDAIIKVNNIIKSVQHNKEFREETKDLTRFTNSLNSLDINKANTMIGLVKALDQMATKLGGLDKLTHELSNELAVVLKHLTKELHDSATVIDKAEKIQESRAKSIKDSISKVTELMKDPLKVIVTQSTDGPTDPTTDSTGSENNKSTDTHTKPSSGSTGYSNSAIQGEFDGGKRVVKKGGTATTESTNDAVGTSKDDKTGKPTGNDRASKKK